MTFTQRQKEKECHQIAWVYLVHGKVILPFKNCSIPEHTWNTFFKSQWISPHLYIRVLELSHAVHHINRGNNLRPLCLTWHGQIFCLLRRWYSLSHWMRMERSPSDRLPWKYCFRTLGRVWLGYVGLLQLNMHISLAPVTHRRHSSHRILLLFSPSPPLPDSSARYLWPSPSTLFFILRTACPHTPSQMPSSDSLKSSISQAAPEWGGAVNPNLVLISV